MCFFPLAWSDKEDCPEIESPNTLWQTLHQNLCFSFLTLLNKGLNCGLSSQSSWNTFWWPLVTFSLLISCKENRLMKKKTDWWKIGDRPMVFAPLTSSQGNSKFNLVIIRGGTWLFVTMGDLASWWAITYNGGTFDNLITH